MLIYATGKREISVYCCVAMFISLAQYVAYSIPHLTRTSEDADNTSKVYK